jgi:hypothetical protein
MSFFLRKKGTQVGMYNDKSYKWIKWVGKKEIEELKRKGYSILEEGSKEGKDFKEVKSTFVDKRSNLSNSILGNKTPCNVCSISIIENASKNEDICFSIFDGVCFVRNKDNTYLYGSFKINFCPSCGKGLNNF